MNKLMMMALVAVTGCSASPLGAGDQPTTPGQKLCTYALTMPFVASGKVADADCIQPSLASNGVYQVSLRVVDGQHDAVFDFHAQAGDHDAQESGFHLFTLVLDNWTCADWYGVASFQAAVPSAPWHLTADLVCSYHDGWSVKLDAQGPG